MNNQEEDEVQTGGVYHLVTDRLMLRDITEADCPLMHQMDTDPLVLRYLAGIPPPQDEEETMQYIRYRQEHYKTYGFGRWAAIEKETGRLIGWAGLKVETNVNGHDSFYDLGYRLLPEYWNRGYATELSKALIKYGFDQLGLERICAYAEEEAGASRRVLEKVGFKFLESFAGDCVQEVWYEMSAEDYREKRSSVC
jgi:[ribosomal protein S5]-alanine N-acetyltransferase